MCMQTKPRRALLCAAHPSTASIFRWVDSSRTISYISSDPPAFMLTCNCCTAGDAVCAVCAVCAGSAVAFGVGACVRAFSGCACCAAPRRAAPRRGTTLQTTGFWRFSSQTFTLQRLGSRATEESGLPILIPPTRTTCACMLIMVPCRLRFPVLLWLMKMPHTVMSTTLSLNGIRD